MVAPKAAVQTVAAPTVIETTSTAPMVIEPTGVVPTVAVPTGIVPMVAAPRVVAPTLHRRWLSRRCLVDGGCADGDCCRSLRFFSDQQTHIAAILCSGRLVRWNLAL